MALTQTQARSRLSFWLYFSCSPFGGQGEIGCEFGSSPLLDWEFRLNFFPDFCSSWLLILGMSGLILLFWFVGGGVALRYLVLFIGVMSCMYVVWDVIGQRISVFPSSQKCMSNR